MSELRCVLCGGYAPFMYFGTSYCQSHVRAAYSKDHPGGMKKKDS